MFEPKDEDEFFKKISNYWLTTEGVVPPAAAGSGNAGGLDSEADDIP